MNPVDPSRPSLVRMDSHRRRPTDRPTRLQIARARAAVHWDVPLSDSLGDGPLGRQLSAWSFADARDAVLARVGSDQPRQAYTFAYSAGVHARGYDFGPYHDPVRTTASATPPTPEQESVLIDAYGLERYEQAKRRVARGELDSHIRRTRSNALSAALTVGEAAEWIGRSARQVVADIHTGHLFAFICDDEFRLPAWQFTTDPHSAILRHLPYVTSHFQVDQHPSALLGFMTTPHVQTVLEDKPVTPIAWLLAGGEPQKLIDVLDSFLLT